MRLQFFSYFAENNSSLYTCDLPHIIISIVSESLDCCLGNFYCMNLEPFSDDIYWIVYPCEETGNIKPPRTLSIILMNFKLDSDRNI